MKAVTITCDGCGKDITSTGAMPAFRLRLTAESLPNTTNVSYAVIIHPPIKEDHYFCGLSCLYEWMNTFMVTAIEVCPGCNAVISDGEYHTSFCPLQ